jgi:hypothetical protein
MSRERSAGRLYRLHLGLGALAAALVAGVTVSIVAAVDFGLPSPGSIAAACDRWLSAGGPAAVLVLGAFAVALASLGLGARSALRQMAASRRFLSSLPTSGRTITLEGGSCRLIEARAPEAFCAGYLRPQVYLSRGALEQLSPAELRAVVAHELHHVRRRDPLRLLLARSLADGLFFIPLLRRTSERYADLGELAADEAAVRRLGTRAPLASALLQLSGPPAEPAPVVGIAPERVDHLMGDPEAGRWRIPRAPAGRSALALMGLAGLLAATAHGLFVTDLDMPILLSAGCMIAMVGGPMALAATAVLISRRALRARRA